MKEREICDMTDMTAEKQGFQSSNLIFFLKEVKAEAASSLSALSTLKVPYLLIGDFLIHILGGFCYSVGPRFAQKDSKDLYELLPESLDPSSPETLQQIQQFKSGPSLGPLSGKCGISGCFNSTPRCSTCYY